jgi:hypothetical protein
MKPQIKIKYGKLLDPFFIGYVENKYPEYSIPQKEDVLEKVKLFKNVWDKKGDIILDFIIKNTGLEYKRNIIDCYIVTATPRDMSSPLIIRSRYNEKEFLYIILHELIHNIFSDNKVKYNIEFKEDNQTIKNHVVLFLLIKKYYLEIEKDENFLNEIREKSNDPKNIDYKKAWEIVDTLDYKNPADYISGVYNAGL